MLSWFFRHHRNRSIFVARLRMYHGFGGSHAIHYSESWASGKFCKPEGKCPFMIPWLLTTNCFGGVLLAWGHTPTKTISTDVRSVYTCRRASKAIDTCTLILLSSRLQRILFFFMTTALWLLLTTENQQVWTTRSMVSVTSTAEAWKPSCSKTRHHSWVWYFSCFRW